MVANPAILLVLKARKIFSLSLGNGNASLYRFFPSVFKNKLVVVFYDQTTQVPLSSLLHSKESL